MAEKDTSFPVNIPSNVHSDLFHHQLIEDPFWENNELKLQWIEEENFTYSTTFQITEEELTSGFVNLVFEGLDTYSEVLLNNQPILLSDNMFITYEKEVKSLLLKGENKLEINFTSPINQNRDRVNNYPYKLPQVAKQLLKVGSLQERLLSFWMGLGAKICNHGNMEAYLFEILQRIQNKSCTNRDKRLMRIMLSKNLY